MTFQDKFNRWKNGERYWDIIGKPLQSQKDKAEAPLSPQEQDEIDSYLNSSDDDMPVYGGGKSAWRSSDNIRRRIAKWEGASMRTNNSFSNEDTAFYNQIPADLKNKMSQDELDALYSYSYNVGSSAFRNRVVPNLKRLYNGTGSIEEVERSMYGKLDSKLRGLAKRRSTERQLFRNAYIKNHSRKNLLDRQLKQPYISTPDALYVAKPIQYQLVEQSPVRTQLNPVTYAYNRLAKKQIKPVIPKSPLKTIENELVNGLSNIRFSIPTFDKGQTGYQTVRK